MGSFFGHALPGTCFYIYGLWYLINTFYYHFKNKAATATIEKEEESKSETIAYSVKCCCSTKTSPLEGILKVVATSMGMAVESLGFFWGVAAMYQHFTMYASFCFTGIIDILIYYKFSIPKNMDHCMHMLSFFLEGLQFSFHLHGRSPLDITLHTLLIYSCYFCVLTVLFMLIFKDRLIFKIMFVWGVSVQGTWFWQVGEILYPVFKKDWCKDCHNTQMLSVMLFCWHVIINVFVSVVIYMIMAKFLQPSQKQSTARYQYLKERNDMDLEDQTGHLLETSKNIERKGVL